MKAVYSNLIKRLLPLSAVFLVAFSACERSIDGLSGPTFTQNPNVFIDGFSSGLEYYPFQGSKLNAFSVDNETTYGNTQAAMRFDVPNYGDPSGAYAGAIFRDDNGGRDLSPYNALTFYIKATSSSKIPEIGFGQDFGENKFQVSINGGLKLSTYWQKVVIPIPNASKLTQEKGMFWYAAGPVDSNGYSFWVDEVKFEKLGSIGQVRPYIVSGANKVSSAFEGQHYVVDNVGATFNVADIGDITLNSAQYYFDFTSSVDTVATTNDKGEIVIVGTGTTEITASLNGIAATGSLTLNTKPVAPTPTRDAANVISIFSDSYDNRPVDYFNGYWLYSTTQGQDDIDVVGNKIIHYTNLNFVGIEFQGEKTIDATDMTHFHIDFFIEDTLRFGDFIDFRLQDLGPDNVFGGGDDDDGTAKLTVTSTPRLVRGTWISADIALTRFTGLASRANLAQIGIATDATITNVYIDNMYFYKE